MSENNSLADAAQAVFVARQPALHPVLQQIQQLRQTFAGNNPYALSSDDIPR